MEPVLIIIITIILVISLWMHYRRYSDIIKLPGPTYVDMLINLFSKEKPSEELYETLIGLNKKYGPVVKLWLNPLKPMIIVSDARYVEYLLSSNVHLGKSRFYNFLKPYIGTGLASSEGEQWKKQRKLLNTAFHNKILESYVYVFEDHGKKLVSELEAETNRDSYDVFPIFSRHTLQIISETVLNTKDPEIRETYFDARTKFYSIAVGRALSLKQYEVPYKLTNTYREQQRCVRVMKKFSDGIVDGYKNNGEFNSSKHVIDLLLQQGTFNRKDVKDQVDTFIVAGHDTTASTMSLAIYELAKHPNIQSKILEETNLILGQDKHVEITFHDVQQMKYLDNVIKELLRLYAAVPFFERRTDEDIIIDNVRIPKNTDISICAYNLHRSEAYFDNPEVFDPNRFSPENVNKIRPYSYIPFSAGPRICIGKTFAMIEMKLLLAKIIRNFELIPTDPQHELIMSSEFVIKSNNGVLIKLIRR